MVREILRIVKSTRVAGCIVAFCAAAGAGENPAWGIAHEWTRQWVGSGDSLDAAQGVSADGLGNVYVAGNIYLGNTLKTDAFLRKYNSAGSLMWSRQFGTSSYDFGDSVSTDTAGNVYISGRTDGSLGGPNLSSGDYYTDLYVAKYDGAGTLQWTRQFGTSVDDVGGAVSVDGLGNVFVAGFTRVNLQGGISWTGDAFVRKYDSNGSLSWTRQLGTAAIEYVRGAAADGLGNVYVSGYTEGSLGGTNAGAQDAFVSKYDATGVLKWTRQLGTASSDESFGVAADALGNVYISGRTDGGLGGPSAGAHDAFVAKYDGGGDLQWTRQLGTASSDFGRAVSTDGLGNVYISGETYGDLGGPNPPGPDPFVAMYDSSGVLQWTQQLLDAELQISNAVSVDALGNAFIAGLTTSGGGATQGMFVTKFSGSVPEPSAGVLGSIVMGLLPVLRTRRSRRKNQGCRLRHRSLRAEPLENRQMLDAGWAASLGGIGSDRLWDLAGDAAGNTYVVGEFSGTVALGSKNLTSAGGSDVFVAKLNSVGQVQWATRAGGTGTDLGYSVAVDASGNVLLTGHFSGSAKFGSTTLVSSGGTDVFVAEIAGNNGNFQWARKTGGSGNDRGLAVETDSAGNVYVTGGLNGANFTYAGGANSQYGANQVFVQKYNTSGTQQWSRTVAGNYSKASFEGLAVDGSGSVYVAGALDGTASFPTGAVTSVSTSRDLLIGKLNSSGTWQWAETVSGTVDGDVRGAALAGGKLYVAGAFEGAVNFDAHVRTSSGVTDGFVASFDVTTRSFDWAQRFGGAEMDIAREVAVDAAGNIHAVGSYRGAADFGSQTLVNASPAGTTFVTQLSSAGAFLNSESFGGPGTNSARNIAFDSAGNRYVGGHFDGSAAFPQRTLTSAGATDSYVTRLAQPSALSATSGAASSTSSSSSATASETKAAAVRPRASAMDEAFAEFDDDLLLLVA